MNFDDFCIYMAGFDRLGRYLYGSWWTGNEHNAYPVEPPEKITEEKLRTSERIDETHVELSRIRDERRKSLSAKQITELDEQEWTISEKLKTLNKRFYELPYNIDSHTKDYDEYMRRITTTEYLQQALKNDSVMAWFGISPIGMRWSEWGNRDGFTLYPELSMIHTPNHGRNRRMTVFFKISNFDDWLRTLESFNPENQPEPTIEEIYQEHMRDYVLVRGSDWTKPQLKEYVREQEGHVQTNAFDRAYRSEPSIPSEKKKGGRPRKL